MAQSILNNLLIGFGLWFDIELWSIVVQILRLRPAVCWGRGGAGDGCSSVVLLGSSSVTGTRP